MSEGGIAAAARAGGFGNWVRGQLRNIAPFATLLFLVLFFSLASDSFFTGTNFANILNQISITGIIAVGLTFVILCAEIDLSVAAIANVTGIVVAFFTLQADYVNIANLPLPGFAAVIIALIVCFGLGVFNALGVTIIGIPSFIMTLAMMQIADGMSALFVRGQIAYAVPSIVSTLGSGSIWGVPWIVIVAGLFLLAAHLVLTYTRFGRYVYMVGGNAQQNEFTTYLLDAIAAVVIGGTSLFGGRGGIPNTIVGLLVLGVLNNGLDHVQIDPFLKILIRGLILLAALIINVYAQRLRSQSETGGD